MRFNHWRVPVWRRLVRGERGQAIVLGALLLLFVTAAVLLTFSVGYRTREKIKLQSLADSGAYSISVMEARLFNYFAWANRTHAAHDVAILSIHAHSSYITFMEGLLSNTKDSLNDIQSQGGAAWCATCLATRGSMCCKSCQNASKFGKAAKKYYGENTTFNGQWLHQQWHQSDSKDKQMMQAAKTDYSTIAAIYSEQKALQDELAKGASSPQKLQSVPQAAAQVVDPAIESGSAAAKASAKSLTEAISWGPSEDWKEMVSATRDPGWIYNRSYTGTGAWMTDFGKATQALMPCIHVPKPYDGGNAKTTKAASSVGALQSNIHNGSDSQDGWGRAQAYGAEDHGGVTVVGWCPEACYPWTASADNDVGVQSGPQQIPAGRHFFFHENKQETQTHHMGGDASGGEPGVYYKHPRYKYGAEDFPDNEVWGHPHPVVVLTKDHDKMVDSQGKDYPFEFNVNLAIPVPVHFQTKGNKGDQKAGNKMAAIAGGLVYYHKPGDWQEPPSFWNPFWRAKLHPLKGGEDYDSRGKVLDTDHKESGVAARPFIRY